MGRPVSLLQPILTGLPLLSRKRPPHSPYVTHTLPGLTKTIMLGLSTARGQHHFPVSSVLLSVAGEMSDPQLFCHSQQRAGIGLSPGAQVKTSGNTKVAGTALV